MTTTAVEQDPGYVDPRLIVAGVLMCFVLPPGGVVVACMIASRRPARAFAMIVTAAWFLGLYEWLWLTR